MLQRHRWFAIALAALALSFVVVACGDDDDDSGDATPTSPATETAAAQTETPVNSPEPTTPAATETATEEPATGSITLYSGRSESLVGPIIEQFSQDTGIDVDVKYGGTSELAALLLEEGDATPADVYFSQDGGALGAVASMLEPLPEDVLANIPSPYKSDEGLWVGLSARARVITYNTGLDEAELPTSYADLTDPRWEGQVAWAPTNASFHTFVTLLRELEGEDVARQWLEDMIANGTRAYDNNRTIVEAVARGEVQLGLVNHYYLWGFIAEQGEGFQARNHYTAPGDPATFVNVAGAGVLAASDNKQAALALIEYLLSEEGQTYFSEQTYEYPVVDGIEADPRLVPLSEIDPPDIDLSRLDDLQGTLALLQEVGLIQ